MADKETTGILEKYSRWPSKFSEKFCLTISSTKDMITWFVPKEQAEEVEADLKKMLNKNVKMKTYLKGGYINVGKESKVELALDTEELKVEEVEMSSAENVKPKPTRNFEQAIKEGLKKPADGGASVGFKSADESDDPHDQWFAKLGRFCSEFDYDLGDFTKSPEALAKLYGCYQVDVAINRR